MARMGYVQIALRVPVDLDNPKQVERAKDSLAEDLDNRETMSNLLDGIDGAFELVEDPAAVTPTWLLEDTEDE